MRHSPRGCSDALLVSEIRPVHEGNFHVYGERKVTLNGFWMLGASAVAAVCIKDVVHHSDRGSQYLSIRYSERLAEAKAQPSVGSVGDSDDNALAETAIGLYKT